MLADKHGLELFDRDGALAEATDRAGPEGSRTRFLGALAGASLAALAAAAPSRAQALSANDKEILNYALTLEELQAAFYTEAEGRGALRGRALKAARVVGAVERAHVAAFRSLLGRSAIKRPAFDFQGTTDDQREFLRTAVALEDLAVAAYKGQAPLVDSDAVLAAAVAIHSVEARHAAWMRHLFGIRPVAGAFDQPLPRSEIDRIVASTRFIAARPQTRARGRPRFTG